MEAEGNQRKTCEHCASYCEQQNGLITQECRRRTAPAPHVSLGNQDNSTGVSDLDYVKVRFLVYIIFDK